MQLAVAVLLGLVAKQYQCHCAQALSPRWPVSTLLGAEYN